MTGEAAMAIIGILLLATAGAVVIDVAAINSQSIDVDAFGLTFATSTGGAFIAGAVAALIAIVGVLLLVDGLRRRRRQASERRALFEERDQLAATAEEERAARERAEAAARAAVASARVSERPVPQRVGDGQR